LGIHAPKNGERPELTTMTEKNLSKKTKENAVIIPNAKFTPMPSLFLNDEAETANNVRIKVDVGRLHLLCLANK
jgi:hypothetical protein